MKSPDRISVPELVKNSKLETIIMEGSSKVACVLDFDKTLTYPFWNGKNVSTSFSQFRDLGIVDDEYTEASKKLFTEYHPKEISSEIDRETKSTLMKEWWEKHLKLFEKKVTRKHIQEVAEKGNIHLRNGVKDFFTQAYKKDIPVVLLSAGLGNVIVAVLEREGINFPNVTVVSNFFEFDESGLVVGHSTPVIHSQNKNETELPKEILEKLSGRTNIILAGDAVSDLGMSEGLPATNILSFGFLNDSEAHSQEFNGKFDVVIKGKDEDFSLLTELVDRFEYPTFPDSDPRREMIVGLW